MLSADGQLIAEFRPVNREWVPLKQISPHMVDALIATEDHRFYAHHGIDVRRTLAAGLHTFSGNRQAARRSRSSSHATCIRMKSAARRRSRAR